MEHLLAPKGVADRVEVHGHRGRRLTAGNPGGDLAQHGAELSLELSHPCLARVIGDDRLENLVLHRHLVLAQAIALQLPRPQVPARDRRLLRRGVAVEADHLHAVEQRRRDRVGHVGRRDEQHL